MPIYVAVGDKVEVPGTAMEDPGGFKDSYWEATVIESNGGAKCTVEFDTLKETDDDNAPNLKQSVKVTQLRPIPPNDSDEMLPGSREVNDYVDVLYNGGWWHAIICEVWHDSINVYFQSSHEIYTGITKDDERRVRSRYDYVKTTGGNYEFVPKIKKKARFFANSTGERIKWKFPPTVEPVVISPSTSSKDGSEEEEEEEIIEEEVEVKKSTKKGPQSPVSNSQDTKKLPMPKDKHKLCLKHLIKCGFLAPGDDVYVLEHLGARHGTVMENGMIMVDNKFTTSTQASAPKEYLLHVVPKNSKLRKVPLSQHWQDVYARLSVDCGVRQLQALRNAVFSGKPLPPPLPKSEAPLPKSLSGGAKVGRRKRKAPPVKEPSPEEESESEEEEEEVVVPRPKPKERKTNAPAQPKPAENKSKVKKANEEKEKKKTKKQVVSEDDEEDSFLASEFFGPSESDAESDGKKLKSNPKATPVVVSAAAPAPKRLKGPASATEKPPAQGAKKQTKKAANKQVSEILKDLEDTDVEGAPSGPALSPLRAKRKAPPTKFAVKSPVSKKKAPPSSPSSSSSPSLSAPPPPPHPVAVKPTNVPARPAAAAAELASKSSLVPKQPLPYLPSTEERKIWCLDNVPQWVLAPALQKALTIEISIGIINVEVPYVALENGKISHPGYAVIRFSTANLAEKAEPVLRQLCIRSSACGIPRPLILRRPWLTKDYPWGKQNTLPGHLPLQMQGPPPPHYAQPNTFEFEMAVQWTQLERAISTARNNLHKEQAYELARVMSHYLSITQQGKSTTSEIVDAALHAPPPPPPAPPGAAARGSSFLWIRGVSPTLKVETLKEVFAQHGYPQKAEMLRDKVTQQVNGTALVQMESADRAEKIARNMQDMEFMLGGSPRPLQVEVAKPGGPRGSQSVFDRALRAVVGKHDCEATTLQLIRIPVVIKETASLEHRAAGCLRELMMTHRTEQDAARQVAREARAVLAQEQMEQFSVESAKMKRLKELHDGQAYKKMCELHTLAIKRLRHSSPTHLLEAHHP